MTLRNTPNSFGLLTKIIHWAVVVIVLGLITVGVIMHEMPNSPEKFQLYGLHKATGITLLTLVIFRLGWRIANPTPPILGKPATWEIWLARANHGLFYVVLIIMPLAGWGLSSAANIPVSVFGLFTMPALVAPDKELIVVFRDLHFACAVTLSGLITLHVAGALKHQFVNRDGTIRRMWFGGEET